MAVTGRNSISVRSHMRLFGDLSFDKDNGSFPTNPATNQISLVDGILYIYSSINGVRTWYPLTHKKSAYVHTQAVASSEWTLAHNQNTLDFGYFAYDTDNNLLYANIEVVDADTIKIKFNSPVAGKAIMFFDYEITAKSISAGNLDVTNIEGMFSKVGDDIVFSGNLIPDTADTWTIGNATAPVKDMYLSANTLHVGDLTLSQNNFNMPIGSNLTSPDQAPSIETGKLIVNPVTYDPGEGSQVSDASISFRDSTGNENSITFSNSTGKYRLDTFNGEGFGSLEAKSVTLNNVGNTALVINGDVSSTGTSTFSDVVMTNMTVNGGTTFSGTVDLQQPLVFTENATIGDGDDNVTINSGGANFFKVISQYFNLDENGNLTISGDCTVNGTLTTTVQDIATTTNSTITDQYFVAQGSGTLDAGIQIDRGASTTAVLQFNESTDKWEAGLIGNTSSLVVDNDPRLLTAIQRSDLTNGGDTNLHYHPDDRNRTNHTGTQPASTISDFSTAVTNIMSTPLSNKVDKITGWGLTQNNYTDVEKAKLESIDVSKIGATISWSEISDRPNVYYESAIPADDLTVTHVDNLVSGKLANGDNPVPVLQRPNTITVVDETVTTYTVNYDPTYLMVYIGRQILRPSEYTATNGTSITFNIPLALDDEIDIITAFK